jgi:hypothetical protein
MPRPLKAKTLATITATREGSTYQLQIEDEAGKKALFELTSDQALRFAYDLDNLLADEEEELHPGPAASASDPFSAAESLGIVKWYNPTKGCGFVKPRDKAGLPPREEIGSALYPSCSRFVLA